MPCCRAHSKCIPLENELRFFDFKSAVDFPALLAVSAPSFIVSPPLMGPWALYLAFLDGIIRFN